MAAIATITREAGRLWADPASRSKILAMHARGDSFLEMVSALGLDDALDADGLRDVVANLSPEEVEVIRDAFVNEAAAAPDAGAHFPIDCRVDDPSGGVTVTPVSGPGGTVARIQPVALS